MATDPTQTPAPDDPEGTREAAASQGKQDAGVVGQSSGRPTYGTGGYELNLDDEEDGGSGSASSTTSKAPHESTEEDK